MIISAKTEYACIAALELALQSDRTDPVPLKDIADKHGIPARFLVQIMLQLKSAGIVRSIRGASGGYQLDGDPDVISLSEVMKVCEGNQETVTNSACGDTSICKALQSVWQQLADERESRLNSITLSDLVDAARGESENMYYI